MMSRRKTLLLLILGIAFLLRAGVAWGLHSYLAHTPGREFLIAGDAAGYWELGLKISHGEDYAIYDPPRKAMRMPGFPLFLAACAKLSGESLLFARLSLAFVGTIACALVYLLAKELFNESTALLAATFAAAAPHLIGFSVTILSETLFATCLLASLWLGAKLIRAEQNNSSLSKLLLLAAGFGMAASGATFVRPTWLLAPVIFSACWTVFATNKLRTALLSLVILGLFAGSLLPWALRNRAVTGHFVATTLWVGPSLYDGLNPEATGDSNMEFLERDNLYSRMSEYAVDRHYRAAAWQYAISHPQRALQLALNKSGRYWNPFPNAAQFGTWWQKLAVGIAYIPLLLLGGYGAYRSRDSLWPLLICCGPLFYFAAIHAVFVGSLRYRLPAEYPLCVIAAWGMLLIISKDSSGVTQCDATPVGHQ